MTQLFDAQTYEQAQNEGPTHPGNAGGQLRRHLRSMPTGTSLDDRTTQWRLDDQTIETGRKGIQAARQALQDAARASAQAKETATKDRVARKAA